MIEEFFRTFFPLLLSGSTYQILLNIAIPLLIFCISNSWHRYLKYAMDYIRSGFKTFNTIELSGSVIEDKNGISTKFSNRFKSLIFYINQHCMEDHLLKRLTEISFNNYNIFDNSPGFETEYLIDQDIPLKLTDNIFCNIRIKKEQHVHDKKTLTEKIVIAKIYSETISVNKIKLFLKLVEREYADFIEMKMLNNTFCFIYLKDDEYGQPIFNISKFSSTKTFDNLIFRNKIALKKRLDFFLNNNAFYNKLGIPYTLGLLLYGSPGCGKTSTVKAIANYSDRHLIVIPMNKISKFTSLRHIILNDEISSYKIPHSKRLYIFEEIDCNGMEKIISKRNNEPLDNSSFSSSKEDEENIKDKIIRDLMSQHSKSNEYCMLNGPDNKNNINDDKITLGSLLELLDGINEAPGRILIMTTNKDPSNFDDALLRPGRIDIKMEFSKCNRDEINQLYKMWFDQDIPDDILNNIKEDIFSPADLGELFINNISNPEHILELIV
jgi:hypothetical protein